MRKKLTIAIPILALFICITIAGTITIASSGAKSTALQSQALETQKQIILNAITQRNLENADAAFNQIITGFAQNENLDETVYNIGKEYQYTAWNTKKANEAHKYNIEHFPDTKYGMLSNVEIIRSQLRSGKNADKEVDSWMNKYKDRSDSITGIYQIAQACSANNENKKALELFQYAGKVFPNNIYGILSQIRYDAATKNYEVADISANKLIESSYDNDDVKKGIRDLANFYRDKKEYSRAVSLFESEIENQVVIDDPTVSYKEAIYCYIDMKDIESADSLIAQMQSNLADNPNLARANFDIGNYFLNDAKDSANALKMHRYNASHYTDVLEAMWSQAAIVWYYVRENDQENAETEYARLLDVHKNKETLPKEVFQIGDIYLEVDNSEKARTLYQQVLDEWPESEYVFNAKAGFIKADIHDGYDKAALNGIDKLIEDYIDNDNLPRTVFLFGEEYWDLGHAEIIKDNMVEMPNKQMAVGPINIVSEKSYSYYTNAQNIWEKIIKNTPSSSMVHQAYRMAAEACKIIGENDKAIEYFQTIVDKWPDDNMNSHCLNMIASIYKNLQSKGELSQSEAESKMKKVYEQIAAGYPESAPGQYASSWLSSYRSRVAIQKRNEEARKEFPSRYLNIKGSGIYNSNEGAK